LKINWIIIFFFTFLSGQNGAIHGIVLDGKTNAPLIGANIIIQNTEFGQATDDDGKFIITDLPSNKYILIASYIGYETKEQSFTLRPGSADIEITIKLNVSAIDLQEYVITSSRGRREKITDAPAAISIISASRIRKESHGNLGDYFKNIKGVDFTASGLDSYNLSARGFNSSFSSRLLTLTDGRMANVPSLRLIAYNVIPVTSDDVEQIEVVLGPSSALYGPNAHSGVINIITKKPSEYLGTNLSYTAGTRDFRKWQVRHSGKSGKIGYKLSFVDFSAYDWEWIDEEEKKAHMSPWIINDGELGSLLDDGKMGTWDWDGYNIIIDKNLDGKFTYSNDQMAPDSIIYAMHDVWGNNINADIENQRVDLRLDYNFSNDHFMSINFGQAIARNINITGIGRYLADGWHYRYYQYRHIYQNWFTQVYLNTSSAGDTRSLRTGDKIFDESNFFHFQIQNSLEHLNIFNSKFIWGFDYQRTMPKTYGSILPDGTAGLAPKNPESYGNDGEDNDGDGKIDEWDELFITNEYGIYSQLQSKLHDNIELIAAVRLDLHSGLIDNENGIKFISDPLSGESISYSPQWSPKIGLLWKPFENQTFRLTSARAFETPSSQGLYLDINVGNYAIYPVKARGNLNGYHYTRNHNNELMMYDLRWVFDETATLKLSAIPESAVLYIPPLLGRPSQFVSAEDYQKIEPVKSEVVWTNEIGYSGLIGGRMRATLDIYHSTYNDFVSDLTWITPVVLDTSDGFENSTILGFIATSEHDGFKDGGDGIPGSSDDIIDNDDPVELIFTNINYGEVKIWGCDASMYAFLSKQLSLDLNFSYLGTKHFYNFLTKDYDPINAPTVKLNANLSYSHSKGHNASLGFRYIPEFDWSAGVFYGTIPSYFVTDISMTYKINEIWSVMFNGSNIFNDYHREIIGGPKLGRHLKLQVAASL